MMKLLLVLALTCVLYGTSQSAVISKVFIFIDIRSNTNLIFAEPEIRIIPALALKFDRSKFEELDVPKYIFYHVLDVLDGNSDPLSTGGTSGTEGGNDGSSDNDDGGKKKKKKGNQGGYKGNKGGKNNWT